MVLMFSPFINQPIILQRGTLLVGQQSTLYKLEFDWR